MRYNHNCTEFAESVIVIIIIIIIIIIWHYNPLWGFAFSDKSLQILLSLAVSFQFLYIKCVWGVLGTPHTHFVQFLDEFKYNQTMANIQGRNMQLYTPSTTHCKIYEQLCSDHMFNAHYIIIVKLDEHNRVDASKKIPHMSFVVSATKSQNCCSMIEIKTSWFEFNKQLIIVQRHQGGSPTTRLTLRWAGNLSRGHQNTHKILKWKKRTDIKYRVTQKTETFEKPNKN